MKKTRKNIVILIKASVLVLFILTALIHTEKIQPAVRDAVMRCLNVVIPSLYGMMILSGILVQSGIAARLPGILPVFAVSQFAGYPIGAKILFSEAEKGNIPKGYAEIMSGVCFGAGPAFIFGCISYRLYGNPDAGKLVLISAVAANLVIAAAIYFFIPAVKRREKDGDICISSEIIVSGVRSGGKSMADICIMVTAFSFLTAMLETSGITGKFSMLMARLTGIESGIARGIISALLDITNIECLPQNNYEILPILSGLVSFGGICVIMQIRALSAGRFRLLPLILVRMAAAIISGIICRSLMPYMISDIAVSAAAVRISAYSNTSPVPSVILIIMTACLFCKVADSTARFSENLNRRMKR